MKSSSGFWQAGPRPWQWGVVLVAALTVLGVVLLTPPATFPVPTATLTPTPTATWNVGAETALSSVPPLLYVMNDYANGDWATQKPEWGPVGGWWWWSWAAVDRGPAMSPRFDWSQIDHYLDTAARYRVTLPDGRVISKPVGIGLMLYLDGSPSDFWDATPQWVYQEIGSRPTVTSTRDLPGVYKAGTPYLTGYALALPNCPTVGAPLYDHPVWQKRHQEMIADLGRHLTQTGRRPAFIFIANGIDGETQPTKRASYASSRGQQVCDYTPVLQRQMGEDAGFAKFERWVNETLALYRQAFPDTPVFVQNAAGPFRWKLPDSAARFTPPIGLHLNHVSADADGTITYNAQGTALGRSGHEIAVANRSRPTGPLPLFLEPAQDSREARDTYWMFLAGLSLHPDAMDVQRNRLEAMTPYPWALRFVNDHLGRTLSDTPDVWIALRDTRFPHVPTANDERRWQSGWIGDYTFWLYRPEGIPGNTPRALTSTEAISRTFGSLAGSHLFAYSARMTQEPANPYLSFDVDDGYPYAGKSSLAKDPVNGVGFRVTLYFLNQPAGAITDTLSLNYMTDAGQMVTRTITKGPGLGPVGGWISYTWVLTDACLANLLPGKTDLRLSSDGNGDEVIHLLQVAGFRK